MTRKDRMSQRSKTDTMGNTLRGAVIGAGFFASMQMDAWKRIPAATIVAVSDLQIEKAKALANRFEIPRVYSDMEKLLDAEELDFVDIITRPESHLDLVSLAAEYGVAVLCQKPLAPSFAESIELVKLAEAHNLRLMVNENWRWQVWYREMKALLSQGAIGEVFHARILMRVGDGRGSKPYQQQPYFRRYARFLFFETGVHYVDTLRFLLGEITGVYAVLRRINPVIHGEDLGLVIFNFEGGATAVFDANRYAEPEKVSEAFGSVHIEGMKGEIELSFDLELLIRRHDRSVINHLYHHPGGYRGGSCLGAQEHFIDCLREGRQFETSGHDYLRTLKVVEAIYASAASGKRVVPAYDQLEVVT